ncbi:MAG: citrate lyase subunit alpha [Peptoniphilaceae bacterium]|nr:citrate lyase subunit alpha [Peptoniphilaceae bacterium]
MKNQIGREGGNHPFSGAKANIHTYQAPVQKNLKPERIFSLEELLDRLSMHDGMTFGFHHHLRNGDFVLNRIMQEVHRRGWKDLTIAASSLFPCHEPLVAMMEDETITSIVTSYVSGPVAKAISQGKLKNPAQITTHGGRPRSILEGEFQLDIAFIAAPAVGEDGAISGSEGPSACGSMGYAVVDAQMADIVVAITDHPVKQVRKPDIAAGYVNYILVVDSIGDPKGIVSGTTQVTKDPIGLKIARDTAQLIDSSGILKDGFSFQTGAGGISLAVADEVRKKMRRNAIQGSFGCGGITGYFVDMLEEGLFEDLYDVQCFDLKAIESSERNDHHHKISADQYANPDHPDHVAGKLDCVILGASEVDLAYNVNVTTGSDGLILGGSGGHADTATGAKLSIITTKLFNARISAIVDEVRTVTTPGEVIDAVVTEYGIAINPKRADLLEKASRDPRLHLVTIEELYAIATRMTGIPKKRPQGDGIVAYSIFRDGTILDTLYTMSKN